LHGVQIRKTKERKRRIIEKRMGQTAEDIRDNIVKIADEQDNCVGTGFFIHKEYCVTCHHNIYALNEIYVEREEYNIETGQQRKRRYHAEWVEEFSDMQKDVAFLKVQNAELKPLEYRMETYGNISVVVRGYPFQDLRHFPSGKEESGKLTKIYEIFHWDEEEMRAVEVGAKKKKWNMKPEVNVPVYAFDGKFSVGFSGAPICYADDWKIVGMFEAKDDNQGYIIPIEEVIKKFDLEKKRKISAPSPTLDTGKIIDMGVEYYYKREYAKAIEQYEIILNDPNYTTAWNNKGEALRNLAKYEEAINCLDRAIEIEPNYASAWYNKGLALEGVAKYEEAIRCYDKVIEIDPNYAYALNNKGAALFSLGKYEEAFNCFIKSIKIDPNNASAWNNKGSALVNLGRHKEAIRCYDKAIEIDPNYAGAWYNKGAALGNLGRYEKAVQCYDKVVEIDPNYAGGWYYRACSRVKKGDIEEGLADLKKAIEIDKKYIQLAKQEKSFKSIRNDKRFKALIRKRKI
jgi:tetratricopeptide (TPR) repeat protein